MPEQTEAEFQVAVIQFAEYHRWESAHFRPARTKKGWRTPVQGSMGKGFPDLILAHQGQQRLIFAELKRDGEEVEKGSDQERVLDVLRAAGEEVYVWMPKDWDTIEEVLRG